MLEGKSTSFGELLDNDHKPAANNSTEFWPGDLPPGVAVPPGKSSLDVISQAVATAKHEQILEALYDMKNFLAQHPENARMLLVSNPQLAFAILQALIMNGMVDASAISRLQDGVTDKPLNGGPPPPHSWQGGPAPYYPPPPPPNAPPPASAPPEAAGLDPQQQAMLMQVLSLSTDQINALPSNERDAILALRNQFMPGS